LILMRNKQALGAMRTLDGRLHTVAWLVVLLLAVSWSSAAAQDALPKPALGETLESHLGKGYDALRQDRYEVAAGEFRAALELDPKLALKARFPLAVALFEMHKFEESREQFEKVRGEAGEGPSISYYLGRVDLEDRNYVGAVRNLQAAVASPPFSDTSYYLGFACFKQGDLPAAEKWLKDAVQLNPRDGRMQYQLGLVYRKEGKEEDAKKALALSEELRRRDDTESQLVSDCGKKLEQGPREEAHAICEKLYDPDNADKLTELGTVYAQHSHFEAALRPLRRAAELAPQSPIMQYNLAHLYYDLNQFENARVPLADATKRWPDLFPLNALYGAVLFKLNEYQPAHDVLRHAQQLNPQDSSTADLLYLSALYLGRKHQQAKEYAEALRHLHEAAGMKPQEPAPHRNMAEVYSATGRAKQAEDEQQEADRLSTNPAN
jgi:tetratricopeptide (TPR) repeat protein